jgi:asparagine synthase (glutamine-hydrolysing)
MNFSFHQIPGSLKVKKMTLKYLLKKLARKILPGGVNLDRKWGFSPPILEWFRGSLLPELKSVLLKDRNHLFRKDYVEKLLADHQFGVDHSGRLFTLLVFSFWEKRLTGM